MSTFDWMPGTVPDDRPSQWSAEQYQEWGDRAGHPRPPVTWQPEMTTEVDTLSGNELRRAHWRSPLGIAVDLGYVLRTPEGPCGDQAAADAALRLAVWYTGQAADYARRETEAQA
jgi:hypothetical protein